MKCYSAPEWMKSSFATTWTLPAKTQSCHPAFFSLSGIPTAHRVTKWLIWMIFNGRGQVPHMPYFRDQACIQSQQRLQQRLLSRDLVENLVSVETIICQITNILIMEFVETDTFGCLLEVVTKDSFNHSFNNYVCSELYMQSFFQMPSLCNK